MLSPMLMYNAAAKRQLQKKLQDDELASTATEAATSELHTVIETYQEKEKSYQERLEAAEISRVKAARAETAGMSIPSYMTC